MYAKYFKRGIDFILSLCALIVLSPVLLILIILGTVFMGGNPFFTQERPGKAEKIFKLIKFRTMSDKKDKDGNLLPDELRLNKYGKFLRASSLDELPELINILKGDMAIIGPRPLLVRYLARYNEEQHHRHDVRPGLGGYVFGVGSTIVSFVVLGNYGLGLQVSGRADFIAQYAADGDLYGLILSIINTMPAAKFILVITMVCMIAFYASEKYGLRFAGVCSAGAESRGFS